METKQSDNQQEILLQDDSCSSSASKQINSQSDNQKTSKELEDEMEYWKNIFPKIYYDLGAGGI